VRGLALYAPKRVKPIQSWTVNIYLVLIHFESHPAKHAVVIFRTSYYLAIQKMKSKVIIGKLLTCKHTIIYLKNLCPGFFGIRVVPIKLSIFRDNLPNIRFGITPPIECTVRTCKPYKVPGLSITQYRWRKI